MTTFIGLIASLLVIGAMLWFTLPWEELEASGFSLRNIRGMLTQGLRQAYGPVVPVTAGGDGLPSDLVILNRSMGASPLAPTPQGSAAVVDAEPFFLTYREGATGEMRWEAPLALLDDNNSGRVKIMADESLLYLAVGEFLQAYSISDGALRWETRLSDEMNPGCKNCFALVGEHLVLMTQDNMVAAVERQSGTPAWSVRLSSGNSSLAARGFFVIGEQIGLLDELDTSDSAFMFFHLLDAASGRTAQQIVPACASSDAFFPDIGMTLLSHVFVNEAQKQVLFFINGLSGICAQSWDSSTGELVWQRDLTADATDPTLSVHLDSGLGKAALFADVLYINAAPSTRGSSIFQLNLADGAMQSWIANSDYDIQPLWQQEQILVARAKRVRGSEQDELWGIDMASGTRLWQHELAATNLMNVDIAAFGSDTWAFQETGGTLAVIQVAENPARILYTNIEPRTGEVLVESSTRTSDGFWTAVSWTESTAYLTIRNVYALDLRSGELTYTWP